MSELTDIEPADDFECLTTAQRRLRIELPRVVSLAPDKFAALFAEVRALGPDVREGYFYQDEVVDAAYAAAMDHGLIELHGEDDILKAIGTALDEGMVERVNGHDEQRQANGRAAELEPPPPVGPESYGLDAGAPQVGDQPITPPPLVKIKSSAEFVADYVSPDYVIVGVLQRRFCYSLTGKTGSGKTALALQIAACKALGRKFGPCDVEKGRVLFLVGENPDDVRPRWIAMSQQMDFDINNIDVYFLPGVFKLSAMREQIECQASSIGDFSLIIIDSSAAYYESTDENDNVQQGIHARRMRSLVTLPGGPCVLVLCHPTKNANDDNLIPRGGGAFLAELDGNLTATKNDSVVELHWQGKFRGPDFAPMTFALRTVTHEHLKDSKGRLIPTVVASPLSEIGRQELEAVARSDEDVVLGAIAASPKASQADLAKNLGWFRPGGEPYKTRVARAITRLRDFKLVNTERDGWTVTTKGEMTIASLTAAASKQAQI
jgi:hypothetical protein